VLDHAEFNLSVNKGLSEGEKENYEVFHHNVYSKNDPKYLRLQINGGKKIVMILEIG
jgi:hypothetical protein